jgi:GT2 family glycosyltransferase
LITEPRVISVILNTNRREDTLSCLESLKNNTYRNHAVIVLDNQSSDGSIEAIRSAYPDVQIITLQSNRGYAGNNNVGINAAIAQGADWVFVLNEDTILATDCLSRLVETGESDSTIGVVGPMVYHHNTPDVIQSAGGLLGSRWASIHLGQDERDCGQFAHPHEVEWVSGCGILVRREAIRQVGAIDQRYFYYWEETEWCIRIGRAGWKIVHVPLAKLWHKGVTIDHQPKPSVTYYATRNRLLTLSTHRAPPAVWAHVTTETVRTLTSWTIKPKWRNMREHRDAMWQGIWDFFRGNWGQRPVRD